MDRPALLALPIVALAAVVVPLRSLFAFDALAGSFSLVLLTLVARVAWMVVAIVGFAGAGYGYGRRSGTGPRGTLAIAAAAALVGVVLGSLFMLLTTDVFWGPTLSRKLFVLGVSAVLDAALFSLVVLGGYALSGGSTGTTSGDPTRGTPGESPGGRG